MNRKPKFVLYNLIIIACFIIFLMSIFLFLNNISEARQFKAEINRIKEILVQEEQGTQSQKQIIDKNESLAADKEETEDKSDYSALLQLNSDLAGWIKISGTIIDYPVMQTKEQPDFYLDRDFNKKKSKYGVPFIEAECNIDEPYDNLIIYGHNMKDGSIFGTLKYYEKQAYYKEHPEIIFDDLTQKEKYKIFAVFKTDISTGEFNYNNYVHLSENDLFQEYITKVKEFALYETENTPEFNDRLLTLSTCDYTSKDGRLVIVAFLDN